MTLCITLQRLIGLKCETSSGKGIFGKRVMKVWLRGLKRDPEWKKARTVLMTFDLTVLQNSWKKKARMPSGPGALWEPIWKAVSSISEAVIGLLRELWRWVDSIGMGKDWSSWTILSKLDWFSLSKQVLKWSAKMILISPRFSIIFPWLLLIWRILLQALLCLTTMWKIWYFYPLGESI